MSIRNHPLSHAILAVVCMFLDLDACASVRYREFYDMIRASKIPQRTYVHPVLYIRTSDPALPLDQITLSGVVAGKLQRWTAEADGRLRLPVADELFRENPSLTFNHDQASLSGAVKLVIEAPPSTNITAATVKAMLSDYSAVVKSKPFVFRIMAPNPVSLLVRMGKPGSQASANVNGRVVSVYSANAAGVIRSPLDAAWITSGGSLMIPVMPIQVALELDK